MEELLLYFGMVTLPQKMVRGTVGLLRGGRLQRFDSMYAWYTACEPTAQLQVTTWI